MDSFKIHLQIIINIEEFDLIEGEVGGEEIKYRRTLYSRKQR